MHVKHCQLNKDLLVLKKIKGAKRKLLSSVSSSRVTKQQKRKLKKEFVEDVEPEDELDLHGDEVKEALKHLNNFFEEDNLLKLEKVLEESRDEAELEIGLGIHMISKLIGKASTNKKKSKYQCPCGCGKFLEGNDKMWIGSETTWYGELDIIAGNPANGNTVAVTVTEDLESSEKSTDEDDTDDETDDEIDDETDDETDGSPGDRTNVEVKFSGTSQGLNQVVSQAVVFAFTEYNRHREKGCYIPSIIMDKMSFRFVIYNPVDDKLVVSRLQKYKKRKMNHINMFRPILVFWMVLNHRIFFAKSPGSPGYLKSGFHEKMSQIHDYQKLTDYSKRIVCKSKHKHDDCEDDSGNTIDLKTCEWFFKKFGD